VQRDLGEFIDVHVERTREWVLRSVRDSNQQIEQAVMKTRRVVTAHRQEEAMLKTLQAEMSGNVSSQTIAFVDEKMYELKTASRDAYGLANEGESAKFGHPHR